MVCHWVSSVATVSANQEPVFICYVRHLESRILSECDISNEVFQVNPHSDVIRGRQTVKVVVSKPELAANVSESAFVRGPVTVEINRAVHASLKDGPTASVRNHVTQHLDGFTAVRIYRIDTTGCRTILKELSAMFGFFWMNRRRQVKKWVLARVVQPWGRKMKANEHAQGNYHFQFSQACQGMRRATSEINCAGIFIAGSRSPQIRQPGIRVKYPQDFQCLG